MYQKSKICIVTSVFNLRKDRPLIYYLRPAIDLLEDLSNSDINICVFTDQPKERFPQADNIHVFQVNPEHFLAGMWDDPAWKSKYRRTTPELIAIWLGKFAMMKVGAIMGDIVLWHDSGIRMPKLFKKNHNRYIKKQVFADKYNSFLSGLADKYPLVFMARFSKHDIFHGVRMSKYKKGPHFVIAGFILARAEEVDTLFQKIKTNWSLLISNGDYGTEENPLTLYQWERRRDCGLLTYDDWLLGLGLI